jgi:hypothetical protein
MTTPAGYTTVTGSYITDASGSPLADGIIFFAPVDNEGNPVSFRVNGNGQAIVRRVSAPIVNGEFSIVLADTSLTSPVNVGYSVTVFDAVTEDELLGPGYECFQPSGAVSDFDTFLPNAAALGTITPFPQGSANEVLATPASGSGIVGLRLLVPADIPILSESQIAGLVSALAACELLAHKGVPNGYASLDGTGLIPPSQLPPLASLYDALGAAAAALAAAIAASLQKANNLSDLPNAATARASLGLATVAASGAYGDLSGKPTIPTVPTVVSAFTNDAGYLTSASSIPAAKVTGLALVATSGSYADLTGKPTIPTLPTFVDNVVPSPPTDGVTTVFTLPSAPNPATCLELNNGGLLMRQGAGFDYTLSGLTITYVTAPASGNSHLASYRS